MEFADQGEYPLSTPIVPSTSALLRALACAQPHCPCHRAEVRGHGLTHCPTHDDQHPSLSVSERDGVVLWNCKAGCDQGVITRAIRLLFPDPERGRHVVKPTSTGGVRTVYDYKIARHVRLDFPDKTKRMWWEPGGIKMADLPLWNGDLLRESRFDNEPVLLVEGEKDANRGVAFGFCAVSLPGGASQRDFGDALVPLRGRVVVLIPDRDDPGRHLMQAVLSALILEGVAVVKMLVLPPESHDLSDFLDAAADEDVRGARAGLKAMIEMAEVVYE